MNSLPAPFVLVVIAGPQASGKSTVAAALATDLRRHGERVALVELDQIAAMALPTLPDWGIAHQIFGSVVHQWARADLDCVVAEGVGSPEEVAALLGQLPPFGVAITVAVSAPFEVALERAQADLTRGVSREHDFLSRRYQRWPAERARIAADVEIDTDVTPLDGTVALIRGVMDARRAPEPGRTPINP